ncbi:trigger factor [Patescibacteria group bacterium]|nr:trigger factor [Patescibacteria group bacterium]
MTKKNDYQVKKIDNSQIKLLIKVSSEELVKFHEASLKELAKDITIEGFRKGKAPGDMVAENIDREKWLIQTIDDAVKQKYYDVVVESKDDFATVGMPEIKFVTKIDFDVIDKGLEFEAVVDVYPIVKLPEYKKIKISSKAVEVSKEDIEKAIDDLLSKRSTLEQVKDDYKISEGNWIDVDFEVEVEGEKISDAGAKHFPLIIGKNSLIPGFEEQLIGVQKKHDKEFELDLDENFRDKRLAGKKVKFLVTIHEIRQVRKPELNDEFVKALSVKDVSDVAAFRKYVAGNLETEKKLANQDEIRNEIVEKIDEKTEIDMPLGLVKAEISIMWGELEQNLNKKGLKLEEYLEREKLDRVKVEEGWSDQAKKRARINLIIRELVKIEKIEVDEKKVKEYIDNELQIAKNELVNSRPNDWKDVYKQYQKQAHRQEYVDYIRNKLVVEELFLRLEEVMVE